MNNLKTSESVESMSATDVNTDGGTNLAKENLRLKDNLKSESLARAALEKELLSTKTMLREANETNARMKRMLSWQLGQALVKVDTIWDALRLPWEIRKIIRDFHKRRRNDTPTVSSKPEQISAAATANAIKQALTQARLAGYDDMIKWVSYQNWPNPIAARALAELARRAHKKAPQAAAALAFKAQELDPSSTAIRHLGFSLFDAGLVRESVKLLQRNKRKKNEALSNSELHKVNHIQESLTASTIPELPRIEQR